MKRLSETKSSFCEEHRLKRRQCVLEGYEVSSPRCWPDDSLGSESVSWSLFRAKLLIGSHCWFATIIPGVGFITRATHAIHLRWTTTESPDVQHSKKMYLWDARTSGFVLLARRVWPFLWKVPFKKCIDTKGNNTALLDFPRTNSWTTFFRGSLGWFCITPTHEQLAFSGKAPTFKVWLTWSFSETLPFSGWNRVHGAGCTLSPASVTLDLHCFSGFPMRTIYHSCHLYKRCSVIKHIFDQVCSKPHWNVSRRWAEYKFSHSISAKLTLCSLLTLSLPCSASVRLLNRLNLWMWCLPGKSKLCEILEHLMSTNCLTTPVCFVYICSGLCEHLHETKSPEDDRRSAEETLPDTNRWSSWLVQKHFVLSGKWLATCSLGHLWWIIHDDTARCSRKADDVQLLSVSGMRR